MVVELRRAINSGTPCVVQLANYKRTGEKFVNYLSLTPIRDPTGRLTHYVGVQSDISDIVKQKEAELAAKNLAVQVRGLQKPCVRSICVHASEVRYVWTGC